MGRSSLGEQFYLGVLLLLPLLPFPPIQLNVLKDLALLLLLVNHFVAPLFIFTLLYFPHLFLLPLAVFISKILQKTKF